MKHYPIYVPGYHSQAKPIKTLALFVFLLICLVTSSCVTPMPQLPSEKSAPTPTNPDKVTSTPVEPDDTSTPVSGGGYPQAAFAAIETLADELDKPENAISVAGIEPVEWSDSCLDLAYQDEMCAQLVTPGYLIYLDAGGWRYELHTDLDGASIRRSEEVVPVSGQEEIHPLITWENPDCETLQITSEAVFAGKCSGSLDVVPSSGLDFENEILPLLKTYRPFVADTPAGKLIFKGIGTHIASTAEERAIAERLMSVHEVFKAGRAGAAWGLVFSYQRQGGIAGLCDDVLVYIDGRAFVSDCAGTQAQIALTASQLIRLYAWVDSLKSYEYEGTDPAQADALTTRLNFSGSGESQVDDEIAREMSLFAESLVSQTKFQAQADQTELQATRDILEMFFLLLNLDEYTQASAYYGGTLDLLQNWNPDIGDDVPALLERGCKQNGLQCLQVRTATYRGPDDRQGYQFEVEFNNPDGTLFQIESCCGSSDPLPASSFLISVLPADSAYFTESFFTSHPAVNLDAGWLVVDLPPYVP